ncbi:MAG: iron export ABC transporter permease subunit FetB [Leptospirillia bacterium]
MNTITLSPWDLTGAAILVLALAATSIRARFGVARPLLTASVRMAVQLVLIGLVLRTLFAHAGLGWVALIALVMVVVAGREVTVRQGHRLTGWWGAGVGTGAMFISSFTVSGLALAVLVQPAPWYDPRYAIPIMGMVLGNTMNGVALGLNHLLTAVPARREVIEQRLMLGETPETAMVEIKKEAAHTGMIPIINGMAAAGLVNLPGMMTGQILAGAEPLLAVRYQILILLLIAAASGFGLFIALWATTHRLFDERQRLRLDRLR